MKILYVSPYPPMRDGIGDYTWMLANGVKSAGNEIRVVVPYRGPGTPPDVIGSLTALGHVHRELRRTFECWKPDIVHVQFAVAAFGTRTFALMHWLNVMRRDLKVPIVVTLHEVTRESALLRPLGHAVHQWIVKRCDHLILHTDSTRDALVREVKVPQSSVSVIPHASAQPTTVSSSTNENLRARFSLGDSRVLLAFGFIHADKGLDDLIRALGIVRDSGAECLNNVRVVVAGDVRPRRGLFRILEARDRLYFARLMRQVRRMALETLVVVTGYVPDSEVAAWFEIADAAILPYRHAEQSGVESLARAFDVPVLGSAVGGLAEQLAGSPWTFPPCAPERMAETLAKFLSTTQSGGTQSAAAQQAANFAPVIATTMELYGAVTAGYEIRIPHVA
jgi:glycosyltransferase involved in cell wall biosynthesis